MIGGWLIDGKIPMTHEESADGAGIIPKAAGRETDRHDFPVNPVWNL